MHFQNIDFDIDIEIFGNFDIDIGIDIEKIGEILKIWVVRMRQVPPRPWVFCFIFYFSPLSFEDVSWVLGSSSSFYDCGMICKKLVYLNQS